MNNHIQGAALALTVAGFVPGIVCAAALSCQGLLDALPFAFAALFVAALFFLMHLACRFGVEVS